MKTGIISSLLLVAMAASAGEHSLGAHEHGAVKLALAVEKNMMEIDLDGPSETFIGFEHAPKTDKEKAILNGTKNQWEKKLLTLISLPEALGCQISEASLGLVIEGVHADLEAKAKITCAKDLAGASASIALIKSFWKIKKLKVDIVSASASTIEITKPVQVIKL